MQTVLASWYYDGGPTACGFHTTYGVAHKYLPCGAQVTLCYHGCVVATVQDRGPFVPGRTYDLNPATKAAIGCSDLCWLRASLT
jgi:rare lipoprotein A (peptidoglycan hydrolase)